MDLDFGVQFGKLTAPEPVEGQSNDYKRIRGERDGVATQAVQAKEGHGQMDPKFLFVIGVLAAWRLARDYVNEEGPLGLYGRSRCWLKGWAEKQIEASDVNDPRDHAWYWLYDGVDCVVCASFWSSLVVAVLVSFAQGGGVAAGLLWWFGLAGGVLIVERVYNRLNSVVPTGQVKEGRDHGP